MKKISLIMILFLVTACNNIFEVPDLKGKNILEVRDILDKENIEYIVKYIDNEDFERSYVINTEPEFSQKLNSKDVLKIYLSNGPLKRTFSCEQNTYIYQDNTNYGVLNIITYIYEYNIKKLLTKKVVRVYEYPEGYEFQAAISSLNFLYSEAQIKEAKEKYNVMLSSEYSGTYFILNEFYDFSIVSDSVYSNGEKSSVDTEGNISPIKILELFNSFENIYCWGELPNNLNTIIKKEDVYIPAGIDY